jgi:hypothetical protein
MNSYLRKIEAERIVLRIVNEQCGDNALHGLSTGAIDSWAKRGNHPPAFVTEVSKVGALVGAMCERSGERNATPDRLRQAKANFAVRRFQTSHE